MKVWPLSVLKESPLMPPQYAWEVARFYQHLPSEGCFYACLAVARQTPPVEMPGLVAIETVGAPIHFMYTEYPDWEEWSRLERAFAAEASNNDLFLQTCRFH